MLAVVGRVYWYSHSVTTWAAEALDSTLNNGPPADYDPHLLGLTAFAIWCIYPLSWVLASLFFEGLARIVAAISTEQILPIWILAFADWCYGKFTHRPPEGGKGHRPRPFVYRLRRLPAGVPGRNVILYRSPGDRDRPDV